MTLVTILFTISYIACLIIYFLHREYLNANKIFGHSRAATLLYKQIVPSSMFGIFTIILCVSIYLHLPEQASSAYPWILYSSLIWCLFFKICINFLSCKLLTNQIIFVYADQHVREKYLLIFSSSISVLICSIFLTLRENSIISIYNIIIFSCFLCLSIYNFILSFDKFELTEKGMVYRFRLVKWKYIRAYKIFESFNEYGHKTSHSEIIFWIKPGFRYGPQFIQISIAPQSMDSVTQILAEKLLEKI